MGKFSTFLFTVGAGLTLWKFIDQQNREKQARQWRQRMPRLAVITGASSGIGAAFARALAREGYQLLLVARREARLQALAEEIRQTYPVAVKWLVADLDSPADLARIEQAIQSTERLDLLVNNAGFGAGGDFSRLDGEEAQRMVRVMALASMRLARAALPGMIERQHGAIINVSSLAGFIPVRGSAVYGATKAYLNFFTEALAQELVGTGVRVQALCPGFTYTEIHDKNGRPDLPKFLWMEADDVVAESLQGLREGQLYVVPGRIYRVLKAIVTSPLASPMVRWGRSRVGPFRRAALE